MGFGQWPKCHDQPSTVEGIILNHEQPKVIAPGSTSLEQDRRGVRRAGRQTTVLRCSPFTSADHSLGSDNLPLASIGAEQGAEDPAAQQARAATGRER